MKTIKIAIFTLVLLGLLNFACEDFTEIELPTLDQQTRELFSSYVAIGSNLFSGMQNNSLYESSQRYSIPALIARQGGTEDFQQPLMQDPGIPARIRIEKLDPFTTKSDPPNPTPLNATLPRPYNNLSIPSAVLFDAVDTDNFMAKCGPPRNNPFFCIVLRDQQFGVSVLEQALAQSPTLITFWLGYVDILAYAVSGGTDLLPTAANPAIFAAIYGQIGGALSQYVAASGAKIAIGNIPDVSVMPFVNTIPPFIMHPETGEPIMPFLGVSPEDKVLLTALEYINQGYGIPDALGGRNEPLPGHVILTLEEQQFLTDRIGKFNQTISDIAAQFNFALVDINTRMNQIHANGYPLGSTKLTTDFVTGGLFSLDGIHPTTIGSGVVANEFIRVMNQKFGVNIPEIQVGTLPPSIEFVGKGMISFDDLLQIDPNIFKDVVNLYSVN